MTTTMSEAELDSLRGELGALSTASIQVVRVSAELRDHGEGAVAVVQLILNEPDGDTWPLEEFHQLNRQARDLAVALVPSAVDLNLTYSSDEPNSGEGG